MENPAKHLVYRPTTMQLLSILTTSVEIMPKVPSALCTQPLSITYCVSSGMDLFLLQAVCP